MKSEQAITNSAISMYLNYFLRVEVLILRLSLEWAADLQVRYRIASEVV